MAGYTRQAAANIVTGGVIDAADFNAEYNAIEAAFNASTGHTHDGTTGNGPPIENLGPSADLVITATTVRPKTDDTLDFGTSTIEWKDGFFDGTLRTDILTVDETSTLTGNVTASADLSVGGNLTVTGNATINGNLTFGDAATDSVTFGADIDSSILPNTDDTYDLGSATKEWRNLFIDGQAQIDDLVADTADINGGTIDGAVIGGTTPAAITGTTITGTSVVGPLTGDVTGDVTGNVTGDLTGDVKATDGTLVLQNGTNGTDATFTGDVTGDLTGNVTGNVTGDVTGNVTGNLTGNADTATAWATGRNIALTGSVTGTATGVDGSGNVSIATTLAGITLGNDTTGNYMSDVTAGDGITITHTAGEGSNATIAHTDTSSAADLSATARTYVDSLTFDTFGHVTGYTTSAETVTNTDTTYTAGSGLDLTGTTFSVEADLRDGITHVGRDNNDYIDIGTTAIDFVLDGNVDVRIENDGDLHADGDVIAYSTTISDERLKQDVKRIEGALDKLDLINGYTFEYKKDGVKSAGVIAQELEKVLPTAIKEKQLPLKADDDQLYKTVQYDQLHGLLIEAVKELRQEVKAICWHLEEKNSLR